MHLHRLNVRRPVLLALVVILAGTFFSSSIGKAATNMVSQPVVSSSPHAVAATYGTVFVSGSNQLPNELIKEAVRNLYPRNDKDGNAFQFRDQDSQYRLYRPRITGDKNNGWFVSFELNHIRNGVGPIGLRDDRINCGLWFKSNGMLEKMDCTVKMAGEATVSVPTLETEDKVALGVVAPQAVVYAQIAQMAARMVTHVTREVESLSDHGGRANFPFVLQHVINDLGRAMWGGHTGSGVVLREENTCTHEVVGESTNAETWGSRRWHENDEAQSLELYNLPVGATMTLYDKKRPDTSDDYTVIKVRAPIQYYCVTGFEQSYKDRFVEVKWYKHNGIEGKVSYIEWPIAKKEAIDDYVGFQSYNYPSHYIRHRNGLGELTTVSSDLDKLDASFRIVPGLASRAFMYISLESKNYPGAFLRHQFSQLKLHQNTGDDLFKRDATFRIVPGLADTKMVSLESLNFPGYYIRHKNGKLYIDRGTDDLFRADATFYIGDGPSDPVPQ